MPAITRFVSAALVLCALAGSAAAKFKPVDRFTDLVDPVMTALANRANDFAADSQERRKIDLTIGRLDHGSVSVEEDIDAVLRILNVSHGWAPGVVSAPDPPIESAARLVEQETIDWVQYQIDNLNSWVAAIEQDNPLARLTKTKKLIQKASDTLGAAQLQQTVTKRFAGFDRAAIQVGQAEKSVRLTTAPKSCKLRRLLKGEFCFATSSATGLFRANAGEASFRKDLAGNVTGIEIDLYYCNGHNADLQWLDFRILGAVPGTYAQDSSVGGYRQGLGFERTMDAGSTVVITRFDVQNQIVEGTFHFASAGLAGPVQFSGGSFRLEQISQP